MKKQISPGYLRTWFYQNKSIIIFFTLAVLVILVILWMTNRALLRVENDSVGLFVSGLYSFTFLQIFQTNK